MFSSKMKSMRKVLLALAISAVPLQGAAVSLAFNQHATSNLFQTAEPISERISAFSLSIGHDKGPISLLADLDYSLFHETTGLSFFGASAGLDALLPAGGKSAFYLAAQGSGQFFRSGFSAFSSFAAGLTAAFKTYLAPSSILKLQWQGVYASFNDALFDFLSHTAALSLDKYFATRTTLKGEAEWGYKYFLHPFLPLTAEPEPLPTAQPLRHMGSGGGGTGGGTGWGGRRYEGGYGFVPRTSGEGGGAGIGHFSVSALAAQGVGDAVGLSLSALRQWIVAGENPFLSIEEFYLVQNPSADDFSWEGTQLNARLTLDLPWDIEIRAGYTYADRSFPGVEDMDAAGLPLGTVRNDVRKLFEARLEKSFARLTLFAAYSYIDNRSSDPRFDWTGHSVLAGLDWSLPAGRRGG